MVVSKLTAAFFFLAALEPARSFAPSAGSRSLSGIPFAVGRGPLSRQGEGIPTARLGFGASPLSKNEGALSRVRLAGGVANWGRQTCLSAAGSGGGGAGGGEAQHRLPPKLDELATYIGSSADEREASLRLIEIGDSMASRIGDALDDSLVVKARRVPGCVSVVNVAVELVQQPVSADATGGGTVVKVRGTADARVARGMLALLVDGLEGQSGSDVLRIEAKEVIERARIKSLLPAGRNNGMVNMLRVIQDQVKEQLASGEGGDANAGQQDGAQEGGWETALGKEELQGSMQGFWGAESSEEVAVLLSGGVDSSVALRLVQEKGMKPRAFYLKIWLEDELAHLGECPWEEDWNYAKSVADQLGVELEAVSLQREYWDQVVSYLITEAREGRTPNPDIMCNSRIKFGMFYDYVGKHFGHVATGHYASTEKGPDGLVRLMKSPDAVKDQTYFLSNLKQSQLTNAMFPIGNYEKHRVRELAHEFNLPTQSRKDSQGICFLGKLKFEDFVGHHLGENPGVVRDFHTNEELGEHKGLWFHTIGQRKGLGEATKKHTHRGPWYVAAKDCGSNILYVSNQYDAIEAPRSKFQVENINWIPGACPTDQVMDLDIKVRHGAGIHKAKVEFTEAGRAKVVLGDKDSGLAAGQFAAFYKGDECLGAGSISDSTFLPDQV